MTQYTILIFLLLLSAIYAICSDLIFEAEIFTAKYSDIEKVINWNPQDNTKIYDSEGNLLSEQFNEYHHFVPFEEIPQDMIHAITAIEDRKFFDHQGIDLYGIIRAASKLLNGGGYQQGASTITQQVVKNLLLSKEKTITRKLREIVLSLYLEQIISKEKIMEIYCNQIFLGFGSYGVASASKRYFNKELKDLTVPEMALIAGLFQLPGRTNPMKYPDRAKKRQLEVLTAMQAAGHFNQNQYQNYASTELVYPEFQSQTKLSAPYFVDYIVEEAQTILADKDLDLKDSGLKIYTTLNSHLQEAAEEVITQSNEIYSMMEKNLIEDNKKLNAIVEEGNKVEASILVLDRRTGGVVAMVGGRDYEQSQFNRTYQSLRAPGSVFKTITYTEALKRGKDWNDLYYIAPITIGNYRPRTENAKLFSETTLLEAFYKSVNSPAVAIGNEIGVKRVIARAAAMGIETPIKDEAATLLGSSEVTMFDMARVFTTLANKGKRISPIAISKIENARGEIVYEAPPVAERSKAVVDIKTAELINEGLKQVVRRGTGYKISYLSNQAAGKTGTSNESRDNWFAGFTNDLVVITWLGNDNQNSFRGYVSASNTAAPLWGKFVKKSIRQLKTARLRGPRHLRSARIDRHYGHLDSSGIRMYFLPHKVPVKSHSDLERVNRGEKIRITLNDF